MRTDDLSLTTSTAVPSSLIFAKAPRPGKSTNVNTPDRLMLAGSLSHLFASHRL
jgi:hypothetical protein